MNLTMLLQLQALYQQMAVMEALIQPLARPPVQRRRRHAPLRRPAHPAGILEEAPLRPPRRGRCAGQPADAPAVVNGKLFVGTIQGEVCCLSAEAGEVLWRDALDERSYAR
jgi:hypothetical protein